METTVNTKHIQPDKENEDLAIMILKAFIECALENVSEEVEITIENEPPEVEITLLMEFVKLMDWYEEFIEFFKEPAEEYFYLNYVDPQEIQQRFKEFLEFAAKHGLTN